MKTKRAVIIALLIGLVLGGGIGAAAGRSLQPRPVQAATKQGIFPTIFMTGSDGKISTIDPMVEGLTTQKNAKAQRGLQFVVKSDGTFTIAGKIGPRNHYPTVEIGMVDGTNNSVKVEAAIVSVLHYLQAHYSVEYYNMLGFSAGGTGVYRYLIDHSTDRTLPEVKKWVSLDGQYNGSTAQPNQTLDDVLKNGPLIKTKWFLTETSISDKLSSTIQIALLAGSYDAKKETDGVVPWADTFSIYYLLVKNGNPVSRYIFTGANTWHGDTPKNTQAISFVQNFFYE